ncbi:carcinoembryonic antigen-related cell adhesion molecule 3 [Manis pentadactyla]|uniref:carcinoembryonic antigen-related cell adhesion molecule 3 n=1 Tax=Manis pentadactyla TaxID=143292 RepID=UPI00255CECD7|nr:carcinoembryonic antigen-related cell adhesion molecule 3 [Manis pentadactyla]
MFSSRTDDSDAQREHPVTRSLDVAPRLLLWKEKPDVEDRGRKAGRAGTWGRQWSERLRSRSSSHRGGDRPAVDTLAPPAAPAPRGPVPWQGLLLAVSLLTWNLPTTAQLTVESVPPNAVQGQDVRLLAHNPPESLLGYVWYKGNRVNFNSTIVSYVINTQAVTPGITYSGRETIYPNGSLLFQNVTQEDTGYYTLQALHGSLLKSTTAAVQLGVYPNEKASESSPWTIPGTVIGVLVGVALAAALGCFLFLKKTGRASRQCLHKEFGPPAPTPGRSPSSSSTSQAPLPDARAAVPIYECLSHPDTNIYCRIDHKADAASSFPPSAAL